MSQGSHTEATEATGETRSRPEPPSEDDPDPVTEASVHGTLLSAIGDPECRAILRSVAGRRMTAAELQDELDIPRSTLYRKLEDLTATPLIAETDRVSRDGKHPREFHGTVDRIDVHLSDGDGSRVRVDVSDSDESRVRADVSDGDGSG